MKRFRTLALLVGVLVMTPSVRGQESPPYSGGDAPAEPGGTTEPDDSNCPIGIIAEFPQEGTATLCMWELSNCTAMPPVSTGFIYSACSGDVCSCMGTNCAPGTTPPEIEPAPPTEVEDELPPPVEGEEPAPPEESVQRLRQEGGDYILTANSVAQAGRTKKLRSNKKNFPSRMPFARDLIPANAGDLMGFGKNNHKVKYLKVLKLRVGSVDEYYGLYKVYNNASNPGGTQDLPADHYVGVRMGPPTGTPPGGIVPVNSNAPGKVQKLPSFNGGYVREVAVKINIKRGTAGKAANTWFHLFGTVM